MNIYRWIHPDESDPTSLPELGQRCLVIVDYEGEPSCISATYITGEFSYSDDTPSEFANVGDSPELPCDLMITDVAWWMPNPFVSEGRSVPVPIVVLPGTIGELDDGYHTFNSLYAQRMYLTAALVNAHLDCTWKSKKHADGEACFGGDWFIVGFDTPEGPYTYHYQLAYWDLFNCKEIDRAPEWDGHTEKDVARLLSL
jgi:hypothetical protein